MRALEGRRREWSGELLLLLGLAVAATVLFAATDLDLAAARLFYRPGTVDRWPLAGVPPWSTLYGAAPWITASLVLAGLGTLATGYLRRRESLRREGTFLLVTVVLGPGLLVNTVLKDHWNRPRPRDVVEFGGAQRYAPPLLPGHEGGASFPCGHCSVAFLYASGWWIWGRRRPALARVSLSAGILSGFALGLGRMSAGGHFLSDVVWAGLIALGTAHVLYHHVLRVGRRGRAAEGAGPTPAPPPWLRRIVPLAAAAGGAGVLLALFATPHGDSISARILLTSFPRAPRVLELVARAANVEIVLLDAPGDEIVVEGELHGFGLPTSELGTRVEFVGGEPPVVRYRIVQRGLFTDLDGSATIRIPAGALERVSVRLERGDIRVTDATRGGDGAAGRIALDLATRAGRVVGPVATSPPSPSTAR